MKVKSDNNGRFVEGQVTIPVKRYLDSGQTSIEPADATTLIEEEFYTHFGHVAAENELWSNREVKLT